MKFSKTIARALLLMLSVASTANAQTTPAPTAFIVDLYNFALAIGGLLAFLMIVIGGVQYISSAGNGSKQSAAKERILDALLGLLLLIGAFLLLNTINPLIPSLRFPSLKDAGAAPPTP